MKTEVITDNVIPDDVDDAPVRDDHSFYVGIVHSEKLGLNGGYITPVDPHGKPLASFVMTKEMAIAVRDALNKIIPDITYDVAAIDARMAAMFDKEKLN